MADKRTDGTTRGGQEPPDDAQDRPEQNAGYDAAVRGSSDTPKLDEDFVAVQDDPAAPVAGDDLDDRAARDAAAAVRRRERSAS